VQKIRKRRLSGIGQLKRTDNFRLPEKKYRKH